MGDVVVYNLLKKEVNSYSQQELLLFSEIVFDYLKSGGPDNKFVISGGYKLVYIDEYIVTKLSSGEERGYCDEVVIKSWPIEGESENSQQSYLGLNWNTDIYLKIGLVKNIPTRIAHAIIHNKILNELINQNNDNKSYEFTDKENAIYNKAANEYYSNNIKNKSLKEIYYDQDKFNHDLENYIVEIKSDTPSYVINKTVKIITALDYLNYMINSEKEINCVSIKNLNDLTLKQASKLAKKLRNDLGIRKDKSILVINDSEYVLDFLNSDLSGRFIRY